MERKLIFGGEQYLPFARSRIAAIRARGVKYAVERYSLPDASIKVQVVGEDSYIHITGGGGQIAMDAGIIDLVGTAAGDPLRFANGARLDTDSTRVANLPYALQPTGPNKWASWLTYPGGVPDAQIVGTVSFQPFAGHLRPGGEAPSFTAARKPAVPATNPPTWILDPADDVLRAKKVMVASVPASVFTGRTRLYVQSMYGRPLYDYANATATEPSVQVTGMPSIGTASPPTLVLPAFKKTGDTTTYPPVTITTGTGVRFDAATGKHWLINVSGSYLDVYPLVSSHTGESLRPILAGKKLLGRKTAMNPDDRAMLEAFVLAYCLPDVKNAFRVQLNEASSGYAMGYSWHWNASGSAADIVTSSPYYQDSASAQDHYGMESTHRRISITVDAAGNWGASNVVIQGPIRWAVNRGYWAITEPVWTPAGPVTAKSTPRYSTLLPVANAPFYCFYVGDTLNLCTVSVAAVPAAPAQRTMSYGFASAGYQAAIDELTCGMLDGFVIDRTAIPAYFKATFSCGGVVYADLEMPYAYTDVGITITKNSFNVPPGTNWNNTTGYGTNGANIGYPAGWGGSSGYTPIYYANSYLEIDPGMTVSSTRRASTIDTSVSSTATMIVPLYDAEALFMEGTRYNTKVESGITVTTNSTSAFGVSHFFWVLDTTTGGYTATPHYIAWQPGYIGTVLSTTYPVSNTVENDTIVGRALAGRGGATPAVMADLSSYHDASLDYATVNYGAFSGYRTLDPAVYSTGHITPVGIAAVPANSALVGWV